MNHGSDLLIITVASGKGGTGKTTVAVNLALSVGDTELLDCDVEFVDAEISLENHFSVVLIWNISGRVGLGFWV